MRLTVLHDAGCPLCVRFGDWLVRQPQLVPISLVAAGSAEAGRLLPGLDHDRTLEELTVVADDGRVWTREHAWVVALWATASHRHTAERLARPALLPVARAVAQAAAGLRSLTRSATELPGGTDYSDGCATCPPVQQG